MPGDLKYLAVAESALYQARSSQGALGMWQIMEATGKTMGLVINDYVDERRHPEKSTYAAMKYLKEGYEQHGSWMLTLAGYNRGHTGIARDMDFQDGDDYFDLFLNSETSRFIFRIAIIKELMENPAKYGFKLNSSQVYMPHNAKKVLVKSSIDNISDWAKDNGTTYKFVKLLNPWILKRSLPSPPSGQSWEILVPE
jgi:membrane-bound lytic murein transglycosylase D